MPDNPCDKIKGPAKAYCERDPDNGGALPPESGPEFHGWVDGGAENVQELAESLLDTMRSLLAPDSTWAPKQADSVLYQPFLWLGQHLAVAIFVCVVVVCALTAWQGAPRLKQMGASTGWALAAVAGMASVPGIVHMLNQATASAFRTLFSSDEGTLFTTIAQDMKDAADSSNPLGLLFILAALVVALAFAALVFMVRNLGILAFVCVAPLVLASLARGGDTSAVKAWMQRLLGLMFCPFALLLVSPFVKFTEGSLVMDAALLVAADALMLRMIFHGVPYFGPRIARAARTFVEQRTDNPLARAVVRAGAPDIYEQETTPRGPRIVDTPRRAMGQDGGTLFAAYGINHRPRPGRLTTESATQKVRTDTARTTQLSEARRQAREAARGAHGRRPTPAPPPAPPPGTGPASTPPARP